MRSRITSLDGLRTIAFILVFISHVPRLNFSINPFGVAGVSIFFVCSGFLAYYTYSDGNSGGVFCYKKFVQKTYTIHLITFVAAAILQQFWLQRWFSVPGFYDAVKKAVPNLLLVHSLIPDANYYYGFNSVSWYLSSLAILYLVLPVLIRIISRITEVNKGLACIIVIYVFISFLFGKTDINLQWILYISPIMRMFDFGIGMLVAKRYLMRQVTERTHGGIEIIGIVLYVMALFCYGKVPEWISYSLIFLPGTVMIVYGLTNNVGRSIVEKILSIKLFKYLNTISLELYLTHQIIINYVENYSTDVGAVSNKMYLSLIVIGTLFGSCFMKLLLSKNNGQRL